MWIFVPQAKQSPSHPSGYYPSVPERVGSSSPSASSTPPRPWLLWRGKRIRRRIWSRLWRRASWMQRLSGITSEPSTLYRGLGMWTSWLQAFPAFPGRGSAQRQADRTSAISQVNSYASLTGFNLPWCSSKMLSSLSDPFSAESLGGSVTYQKAYTDWATAWKSRELNRQAELERPIKGTAPSSSPGKSPHTATASFRRWLEVCEAFRENSGDKWPTPTSTDARRSGRIGKSKGPNSNPGTTLCDAVREWVRMWLLPSSHPAREVGSGFSNHPNPEFLEHLMGLPLGWTACGYSETEYASWLPRAHFTFWYALEHPND